MRFNSLLIYKQLLRFPRDYSGTRYNNTYNDNKESRVELPCDEIQEIYLKDIGSLILIYIPFTLPTKWEQT